MKRAIIGASCGLIIGAALGLLFANVLFSCTMKEPDLGPRRRYFDVTDSSEYSSKPAMWQAITTRSDAIFSA
jgi:hypothetical protein